MKKFLAVVLLLWMPMQASFAAFEEVHAHQNHVAAHGAEPSDGFHEVTQAWVEAPAEGLQADCNSDCHTHHFCMAQLLLLNTSTSIAFYDNDSAFALLRSRMIVQRSSERPERPQWLASSF